VAQVRAAIARSASYRSIVSAIGAVRENLCRSARHRA
jgi:hypothetical protein